MLRRNGMYYYTQDNVNELNAADNFWSKLKP
jgi:hypothetical protein